MIASKLRPHYAAQAKERQGARNDLGNIPENVPEVEKSDARDEAGKAAGNLTARSSLKAVPK